MLLVVFIETATFGGPKKGDRGTPEHLVGSAGVGTALNAHRRRETKRTMLKRLEFQAPLATPVLNFTSCRSGGTER